MRPFQSPVIWIFLGDYESRVLKRSEADEIMGAWLRLGHYYSNRVIAGTGCDVRQTGDTQTDEVLRKRPRGENKAVWWSSASYSPVGRSPAAGITQVPRAGNWSNTFAVLTRIISCHQS